MHGNKFKLIAERGTYVVQASAFKKDEEGVKDTGRVALFVSLNKPHSRLTESGMELRLQEMGKKLGVEKVQKILGHEQIDTTLSM